MSKVFPYRINILLCWFAGEKTWNEGRTYQKVAEHLAALPEVRKVLVTFPPIKPKGRYMKPLDVRRLSNKLALVKENPEIISAKGLAYRLRSWINSMSSDHALTTYLKLNGFTHENTVLWLFPPHPYLESLIKRIPHSLLVGHIVDNFTKHGDPWLNRYAQNQYPIIQAKSDVLITGSQFNYDIFRQNRKGTYLFENAVDEEFLSRPSSTPVTFGRAVRLGYVGTLSERTNFELLEYVASSHPDWKLLIAGKSEYELENLSFLKLPNVEYLGVIPYTDLPAFLRSLDVCLIPHRNTEYSQSMSPLKLFQYLASGRPIVSSEIAGIEKAKDYIRLATSHDEFVASIEDVLKEDNVEMSASRIDFARNETWEKRVRGMFDATISHLLANRAHLT